MNIEIVVSLVGGASALIGALAGAWIKSRSDKHNADTQSQSKLLESMSARLAELETWRGAMEGKYSRLWAYARSLLDHIYKHAKDGAPPPPPIPDELT